MQMLRPYSSLVLLILLTWMTVAGAESLPGTMLGNLTGPVDTRFMPDHHLYDVVWGNDRFVAVGSGAFDETEVLLSPDGVRWERVSLGKPSRPLGVSNDGAGALYSVAWNGTVFVAVGERILTSSDGKSWTVVATALTCLFSRVIAQGGRFVAVGGDRGRGCIAASTDGRVWTEKTSGVEGNTGILSGVTWNGSTFVAISAANLGRLGVSSALFSSPDGEHWSRQPGPAEVLIDLVWGVHQFIAVGGGGRHAALFASSDLQTWTDRTPQHGQPLRAVLWNGVLFIAVGANGAILTSADGISWSEQQSHTTQDLFGVACHHSFCVAVGDGVLLASADGMQWRIAGVGAS